MSSTQSRDFLKFWALRRLYFLGIPWRIRWTQVDWEGARPTRYLGRLPSPPPQDERRNHQPPSKKNQPMSLLTFWSPTLLLRFMLITSTSSSSMERNTALMWRSPTASFSLFIWMALRMATLLIYLITLLTTLSSALSSTTSLSFLNLSP